MHFSAQIVSDKGLFPGRCKIWNKICCFLGVFLDMCPILTSVPAFWFAVSLFDSLDVLNNLLFFIHENIKVAMLGFVRFYTKENHG